MGITPEKTNHSILSVHGDAIAISILVGRRDDRPHWNIFELADALQNVAYLSPLNDELVLVIDMLIRAAAAAPEIRTLRLYAVRGGFLDLDKLRMRELLLLTHNFGGNDFTLDRVRNEYSLAFFTPDTFPAKADVFDF